VFTTLSRRASPVESERRDRAHSQIRQINVIQTKVGGPIACVQLPAHDGQLLRASEGLAYAFFHALLLLGLVSTAALLFRSLASDG
jgi:hypothetical protein